MWPGFCVTLGSPLPPWSPFVKGWTDSEGVKHGHFWDQGEGSLQNSRQDFSPAVVGNRGGHGEVVRPQALGTRGRPQAPEETFSAHSWGTPPAPMGIHPTPSLLPTLRTCALVSWDVEALGGRVCQELLPQQPQEKRLCDQKASATVMQRLLQKEMKSLPQAKGPGLQKPHKWCGAEAS